MADVQSAIILLLFLIPGKILKAFRRIWLCVDRPNSADDNSWIFFNWLRENHPEDDVFFILNETSPNFDRHNNHIVRWGSLKHYLLYIASDCFLDSTFTTPRPNERVCYYFERYFKKTVKKIYLRHGIHKDGVEMHTYAEHHFRLFICGAKPEYDYFLAAADYPKGYLRYTGFARFDDLLRNTIKGRFILLMPTWRRYIGCNIESSEEENTKEFTESSYYKHYSSLINNTELISFLEDGDLYIYFCLHNMYRKFSHLFSSTSGRIKVMTEKDSIHSLLTKMGMLVTDYSSVFFDAAYTGKPIVYYHFDYDEFRSKHFSKGYFDYLTDGFGPVVGDERQLIAEIKRCYDGTSFVRSEQYNERTKRFFPLHDTNNCERIYAEIKRI